jgi:hypothetical protein
MDEWMKSKPAKIARKYEKIWIVLEEEKKVVEAYWFG